jgi:hypothetical protein
MALGAVRIQEAGDPSIDTCALFASKTKHAVEARVAPRRRLHASIALARHRNAFAFRDTILIAVAGASGCKRTLPNRNAIVAVATRLDADVSDAAVLVGIAEELVWASTAKRARLTRGNRDGATSAPKAPEAPLAPDTSVATRIARTGIVTTDRTRRHEHERYKPSISHQAS